MTCEPVLAIVNPLREATAREEAFATVLARPLPVLAAEVVVWATDATVRPCATVFADASPDAMPMALPAPVLLALAVLCESAALAPGPAEAAFDEPALLCAEPVPPTLAVPAALLLDEAPP